MRPLATRLIPVLLLLSLTACIDVIPDDGISQQQIPNSSAEATFLVFEFDGVLQTDFIWPGGEETVVEEQLLYTIGQLNGHRSVGRLDALEVEITDTTNFNRSQIELRYHARLPVAWGNKTEIPKRYTFLLPKDVSYDGLVRFTDTYMSGCTDESAHDVELGSMWYYYRPQAETCDLLEDDIVRVNVAAQPSTLETTGRYPEYDKIWDDGVLNVVAIFGKYEDGATALSDAGIRAYNTFLREASAYLGQYTLTTTPEPLPASPGASLPEVSFHATLPDGRQIQITALLVDNVRTAGPAFDARYAELSTEADLIQYNGHAGLGQNVRALARKGKFRPAKYLVLFMNGCDTFAYVDGHLAETRAALNPDDPGGTRWMDIVTNAMPSYFHQNSRAVMAMVDGLARLHEPMTYEQIFTGIDPSQVVLVTGEEDNVFGM